MTSKDWATCISSHTNTHAQRQAISRILRLAILVVIPDLVRIVYLAVLGHGALMSYHIHLPVHKNWLLWMVDLSRHAYVRKLKIATTRYVAVLVVGHLG